MDTETLDRQTQVVIGDQEYPVNSILNLDVSGAKPFRGFEAFPVGVFDFTTKDVGVVVRETRNGNRACIVFEYVCAAVHSLKDRSIDAGEVLGRTYQESIFITDLQRDMGKVRALAEDSGGTWGNNLEENLKNYKERVPGMTAGITNYHNKERDTTYANLDYKSIKPLVTSPTAGTGQLAHESNTAAEQSAGQSAPSL